MAAESNEELKTNELKKKSNTKKLEVDTTAKKQMNKHSSQVAEMNDRLSVNDASDSFRMSEFGEGVSPELKSKTHLGMKTRDLKNIESKVKDHIKIK